MIIVIFAAGLSLLLYPTVSNFYNSYRQSQMIREYSGQLQQLEEDAYQELLEQAQSYNSDLLTRPNHFALTPELEERYWQLLDAGGQGVMGYLEIPVIDLTLPIGHGTGDDVLETSVGHLSWSSLPVGGESTHCVLSGHRGLPSAELFTNLDRLEPGDEFYIHVLGRTLTYRVDHMAVVEPTDYSLLGIETGKDYVTLMTCTPYGINSHRLLIRGCRVAEQEDDSGMLTVRNEVSRVSLVYLIPAALAVLCAVIFVMVLLDGRRRKKRGKGYGG